MTERVTRGLCADGTCHESAEDGVQRDASPDAPAHPSGEGGAGRGAAGGVAGMSRQLRIGLTVAIGGGHAMKLLDRRALRQPQTPTTGVGAIFGALAGEDYGGLDGVAGITKSHPMRDDLARRDRVGLAIAGAAVAWSMRGSVWSGPPSFWLPQYVDAIVAWATAHGWLRGAP